MADEEKKQESTEPGEAEAKKDMTVEQPNTNNIESAETKEDTTVQQSDTNSTENTKPQEVVSETKEDASVQQSGTNDTENGQVQEVSEIKQPADEEPDEELFSGDDSFLEFLDRAEQEVFLPEPQSSFPVEWPALTGQKSGSKRTFSKLDMILIGAIILVSLMFAYPLYKMVVFNPSKPLVITQTAEPSWYSQPAETPRTQIQQSSTITPQTADKKAELQTQIELIQNKKLTDKTQPLSLSLANNYYTTNDYENAMIAYNRLYQALSEANTEQPITEFLYFRIACCLWEMRHTHQAEKIFRSLALSNLPLIRILANYYQARIELGRNQFLEARTYAYRASALTSAITADTHWSQSIQKDCAFIIGQTLTRQTIILSHSDADIPDKLWTLSEPLDPFSSLTKTQLSQLLESGTNQLNKALLSPQITRLESIDTTTRYSVTSYASSFEELVARFASKTDIDIEFNLQPNSRDLIKRPLCLYLPEATAYEFVSAAAGCLGLLAHINTQTEKTVVTFENPSDYTNLAENNAKLSEAAISLWQQYLIKYHDDKTVANANFSLALLLAQNGQTPQAIEQFKYVADRFSWSRLSPYALFHSSRLKADMQDYIGARQDLEQLVVQYDDMGLTPKAYLYLAQVSIKAGLYKQAAEIYNKVYNLDFSADSKAIAAFGAAKCSYQIKDYAASQNWLVRYINLIKDTNLGELHSAYLLLGKTQLALGDSQNACNAFNLAIAGQISDDDKMEVVSVLLENQKEKSDLIRAMDVLEAINPSQLSQEQSTNLLILKSQILRIMGLPDKAKEMLSSKINYIFKANLQSKAYSELAKCCIEISNVQAAYSHLTTAMSLVEPGLEANQTRLELAKVALMLGKNEQTISLCLQTLEMKTPDEIRKKALDLLASAYKDQKQLDKALKALIVQSKHMEKEEQKLANLQ